MTRLTVPLAWVVVTVGCTGDGPPTDFTTDTEISMEDENDTVDSFGTRMCLTEQGVVYVLWMDNRANSNRDKLDIYMNRSLDRGDTWLDTPVKVNQGNPEADGPGNVWNPDLYCNDLGVFVVWEDDRDGELQNHQIYFNKSTDQGETFLPEDILIEFDTEGNTMSLEPKITGSDGDLMVAWYDSANGAYDIFVSTSGDAGDSWRDPNRIDSDVPAGSAYSARPQVAMSENAQNLWVVWEDSRDGKADIYFARSGTGGITFDDDVRLDEGTDADGADGDGENDSFEPQLCTDGVSSVYVVWHDSRNSINDRDIYFNFSINAGDDWLNDARQLESDGQGAANSLYPRCTAQGPIAHVAWQDNRNESYDIFYRRIIDGIPEPAAEQRADIGDLGLGNSLDVRVGMNDDFFTVAWNDGRVEAEQETDNGYTDLYYQYFSLDGSIQGTGEADDDLRIDSMYDGQSFKLDVNWQLLGGEWYAAWTDGRDDTENIYFERFPIGEESNPPDIQLLLDNL